MEQNHCLNCQAELAGAYCHRCGQKSDTHRLTMKHFLEHDLIHGIWHLDKGIVRTLRQILTRPGHLARDYIAGKRTGHFNLVTLLVLLTTLFLFSTRHVDYSGSTFAVNGKRVPELVTFAANYAKWLMLLAVPVMAFTSRRIFKRLPYNMAEHLVMCGYYVAGTLCIMIVFRLLFQIPGVLNGYTLLLEIIAIASYLGFAYLQVTNAIYSRTRAIVLYLLLLLSFIAYILFLIVSTLIIYRFFLL